MPLDVWLVQIGRKLPGPTSELVFRFGAEHDTIFYPSPLERTTFPLLFRMEDYYADALYEGEELPRLTLELDQALLEFEGEEAALSSLHRLRDVCLQAVREGKSVLLYAD